MLQRNQQGATQRAPVRQDRPPRRQARGEATRERLLGVAERLFVRRGFDAVTVEHIVRAASLTKGAFYHHFPDKLALFRAVFEKIDREMAEQVMAGAIAGDTPLAMIRAGMRACFALCTQPRYGRLVYIEAPAALGWALWHSIDTAIAGDLVTAGLEAAADAGELPRASAPALGTLLLGAILQSAITIATADDPQRMAATLADEMDRLLLALASAAGASGRTSAGAGRATRRTR